MKTMSDHPKLALIHGDPEVLFGKAIGRLFVQARRSGERGDLVDVAIFREGEHSYTNHALSLAEARESLAAIEEGYAAGRGEIGPASPTFQLITRGQARDVTARFRSAV